MAGLYSVKDRLLQIDGATNNLISNDIAITSPCVDATVTVGAEASDARAITITLKDSNGVAITYSEEVSIILFTTQAHTAYVVTGGSTGIAIGASGALSTIVTKKRFNALSTTAGVIALTWTDTGTEAAAIGVKLPTGRLVMGDQLLTNA